MFILCSRFILASRKKNLLVSLLSCYSSHAILFVHTLWVEPSMEWLPKAGLWSDSPLGAGSGAPRCFRSQWSDGSRLEDDLVHRAHIEENISSREHFWSLHQNAFSETVPTELHGFRHCCEVDRPSLFSPGFFLVTSMSLFSPACFGKTSLFSPVHRLQTPDPLYPV